MEHTAALMMENASAAQDGLASTAHSVSQIANTHTHEHTPKLCHLVQIVNG